ncbi:sensor histidine kinase [Pseudactinotalea suaedae]|uniref:sensor histidine kinase n=1 Tax=Pseudactinotalea suaedae TaxID=1524924 RepID=UPI0019D5CF51|nr:histidine kinase [Pseudactinotalea suaedae]
MTTTWVPPWVRHATAAEEVWDGLPEVQRRYLRLAIVPLGLLSAVVVWSTWKAGNAHLVLDITVGILATAAAPLLWTRYQVPTAIALAALAALSPAATPAATAMAVVAGRLRSLRIAIPVAAAGVLGHAVQGLWRPVPHPFGWWLLGVAAVYGALAGWGAWARTRTELLRSLHDRALRAEQEQTTRMQHAKADERARIAREMHDSLAHHLTLIAATSGALEYRHDVEPDAARAAAGRVRAAAGDALVELRAILRVLRTEGDELRPAPGMAELPALVEQARTDGTDVTWQRTGAADPPAAVGLATYRVLQEALTNARRHAPGASVDVTLTSEPGRVELRVVNGPVPAPVLPSETGSGTGLVGLSERAELLGGTLVAEPQPDGGFAVVASLPWEPWDRSGSS